MLKSPEMKISLWLPRNIYSDEVIARCLCGGVRAMQTRIRQRLGTSALQVQQRSLMGGLSQPGGLVQGGGVGERKEFGGSTTALDDV